MIQAELNGKLPEVENSEDVLTSSVFGLLRYLPPQKGIFRILEQTKDYSSRRNPLIVNLKAKNINLSQYDEVNYYFWEYSSKHGEPDLILIIRSSEKKIVPLMLCIEVKYLSEKSRAGEYDQLMDYCLSLENAASRKTFSEEGIAEFEGVFAGVVYLTYFSQYAAVQESLKEIGKRGLKNYESKLYELRWNDITRALKGIESGGKYEQKIVNDLVELMKKKNFVDFEGFSDVNFALNYEPLFSPPLRILKPERHDFRGFSELEEPDILKFETNVFLEVRK